MSYPAIGIRPIVDGRRGPMKLRESLEPQVWAMAEAAKKLFEENLCYSDGTPVKVVLADTTIGRVPETAACAEKFKRENVAVTLSVTPCWCYGKIKKIIANAKRLTQEMNTTVCDAATARKYFSEITGRR